MADTKISALTTETTFAADDYIPFVDTSEGATNKCVPLALSAGIITLATAITTGWHATQDHVLYDDNGVTKKSTLPDLLTGLVNLTTTEMTGSGAAATDEYLFSDAGVIKTITVPESVAAQFAGVTTTMLGSDVAPATDEIIVSDAGVPKTMTIDELISAIGLNGFATLADISGPHDDQAAAATAISGTGKLWYQTATGLLGITLT